MLFEITQEQEMLQEVARRFIRQEYGFARRCELVASEQGFSEDVWSAFAGMGWLALPFREEDGGLGGGALDLLLLTGAFGAGLVVEPYLGAVVLGGGAVAAAGTPEQRARLLAPLIAGESRLALAYAEPEDGYDPRAIRTTASRHGTGWRLSGQKAVVLGAPAAEHLVVSARCEDGGTALFVVETATAGVSLRAYRTIDGRRAAEVRLEAAEAERLGEDAEDGEGPLEAVLRQATLAVIGEAVGAMETAVALTTEHLKTRVQFDRPLASFQVLQHRLVDMFIAAEEARALALWAADVLDSGDSAEADRALSAAKVHIGEAGRMVGEQAVQLHGAIAITDEFPVGHYLKRLTALDRMFGDSDHHLARLARLPEDA